MKSLSSCFALSFLIVCALLSVPATALGATPEEENKEAAEEDKAAEGKDFPGGFEFIKRGKLFLAASANKDTPAMTGTFSAEGKSYDLKITDSELAKKLQEFDKKDVTLGGKLRNKGKYLVVQAIVNEGQPAQSLSNPRGL